MNAQQVVIKALQDRIKLIYTENDKLLAEIEELKTELLHFRNEVVEEKEKVEAVTRKRKQQ